MHFKFLYWAQESLLCHPAKRTAFFQQFFEPFPGNRVMEMRFKGQSKPEIHVRQKHRHHPEVLQFVQGLTGWSLVVGIEPTAGEFSAGAIRTPRSAQSDTKPSRQPLQANVAGRPELRRRSVHDREYSSRHCRSPCHRDQVSFPNFEAHRSQATRVTGLGQNTRCATSTSQSVLPNGKRSLSTHSR